MPWRGIELVITQDEPQQSSEQAESWFFAACLWMLAAVALLILLTGVRYTWCRVCRRTFRMRGTREFEGRYQIYRCKVCGHEKRIEQPSQDHGHLSS